MKIAFLALSGIRVCDTLLLNLGLTLPGFVERSKTIAELPSLGLLTIAALTPKQYRGPYIESPGDFEIEQLAPDVDVVAISALSARIFEAYKICDDLRAEGVTVVLGGLHVTAMPDEASKHADIVVVGEGESLWGQVVNDLVSGNYKPIYDARWLNYSLSESPVPCYELVDPSKYNRLTIQTTRGCPFRCEFCASSPILTTKYKTKPISKVLEELSAIKSIWSHPFIELADDNTFADKKHGLCLAKAFANQNIRWFTEADISLAEDTDLLLALRDSGCAQVLIGLESITTLGLDGVEMKLNWKAKQVDKYLRAVQTIQSYGISVNGCFVIGLDDTSAQTCDNIVNFVHQSGLHEVQVTILTPFPQTPLYARLLAEGRILQPGAWNMCTLFDVNFVPRNMSPDQLRTNFHDLVRLLYSESETKARKSNFRKCLRDVNKTQN